MREDGLTESNLEISNVQDAVSLCGNREENLTYLSRELGVRIALFGNKMTIVGDEQAVARADRVVRCLLRYAGQEQIKRPFLDFVIQLTDSGEEDKLADYLQPVATTAKGRTIRCKTYGQAMYVQAIRSRSIVFGIGPAGTGKTYLAVALAVAAYKDRRIDKIILTRPAVEAGEKLGFLPGDLGAKVDPYLRPLYDALQEMLGTEAYLRMVEKGIIEIAPLAYMRGRTLSDAFIILDEAQNATREQMKMFLTRMGEGSKIVVTGDATQIDLPGGERASGLLHAERVLRDVRDIKIVRLQSKDVVRHDLVQAIVDAYAADSARMQCKEREEIPADRE